MLSEEEARKNKRRTFQPNQNQKTEQEEMWYTAIPLEVLWGIYARQSTPLQVIENFESTEMQTDDLAQLLLKRGVRDGNWQIFDADLGLSGTLPIDKRTGLQELVEQIKSDTIKAVLVYQISRLFRDDTGVEYNTFAKICKEHDCILMTADGMVFNFNNRMHLKMFRFLAEYAAEFIPQQIGLLNAARMRKARRGLYVGFGVVPRGYIVDYDKQSKTYKKFIVYKEYQDPILHLFERFYALEANLVALYREVEQMPYVFPRYEAWVDKRNIRDQKWKKVPNGYHLSRQGIISMLTNPVYIGWWIVGGDIVSMNNHDPLIPPEKEYLFWYAFDHLSEFTTDGEVNPKRSVAPRRFFHRHRTYEVGLLKDRITAPEGYTVFMHQTEGKPAYYRTVKKGQRLYDKDTKTVEVSLIDSEFTTLLFTHLRQTHEFDGFAQFLNEVLQKRKTQTEIILAQLEEIQAQQEAILDERLSIRTHINQQIKAAVAEDEETEVDELKMRFEQEATRDIERLRVRSQKLDEREKELRAKLPTGEEKQVHIARTFADFQTELEKLATLWDQKPLKERKEFVNLLIKKAVLSLVSTHWIKLTVYWTHPAWTTETLYIYRRRGCKDNWTDEEKKLVQTHYPTTQREVLLQLLPHKSWSAILGQAIKMGLQRKRHAAPPPIPETITWSDYEFCQQMGIDPATRQTLCLPEVSDTKDDSPS
jgi:hypothetical protein